MQSQPTPRSPAIGGGRGAVTGLLLLLALTLPRPLWAEARVSLDRNTLYQGDTATLSVEVDGIGTAQPDLSPLNRDFEVLGTSSSTQISIVNGRRSDTLRWQITLKPRRIGALQVPPLSVGAERTRPLTLTVADAATIPQRDDQVFVELQADLPGGAAYVQQQVPLTVRLYSAAPLRQGTLSDPQAEHAVIERLGEDKRYTADWGGKRYQVLERRFALSPEQSGPLHIPPVVFKGSLPAEGGGRSSRQPSPFERFRSDPFFDRFFDGSAFDRFLQDDPFAAFEPGRPVTVRSQGLEIEVKPKPVAAGGPWLPAEDLVMEDSWAGKAPELRVGEPVTRSLTLRARGLSGSQIPQVALEAGEAVRVYPEAPRSETRTDGNLIYGTSQQAFALIPQRAGDLRLPEVRVKWWDTRSNQAREALIPAIEAKVQPGANSPASAEPVLAPAAVTRGQPDPQPAADKPSAPATTAPAPTPWGVLHGPWLLGAGAVALLAALAGWLWYRRRGRAPAPAAAPTGLTNNPRPDPEPARRAFFVACDANDAAAAVRNLLAWAAAQWPAEPPRSLTALAAALAQGGEAVLALDRALYADDGAGWQGAALKEVLAGGLSRSIPPADTAGDGGLAPLYPRRA